MELEKAGIETRRLRLVTEFAGRVPWAGRWLEEVVAPIVRPCRLLLLEHPIALEHVAIGERRAEPLADRQELAPATDDDFAAAVFGRVAERLGDDVRLVYRRDRHRLDAQLRPRPRE